jgi:hypothetical protein
MKQKKKKTKRKKTKLPSASTFPTLEHDDNDSLCRHQLTVTH